MIIHVVQPGESLYTIALKYGVPMSQLIDQLPDPSSLVAGQTVVIRPPQQVYVVRAGDTLYSIARRHGLTVRQLLQNEPALQQPNAIFPGRTLVLTYQGEGEKGGPIDVTGYAYPFVQGWILRQSLPYLSGLIPFTYGFRLDGTLVELDDQALIAAAKGIGASPVMHLSTLTDEGGFDSMLAHRLLNDSRAQAALTASILSQMDSRGYTALDVDFEYVPGGDAEAYANFIARLRDALAPQGRPVIVALAPKTSADQKGLLYEGHSYPLLGDAADMVLLMTYEWGYTYGPPMAVAPLPNVRAVVEYALTEIPAGKILLGMPNYGYDWPLPFVQGRSKATSISNQYAVTLAGENGASISYDERAQAPYFRYRDARGTEHEVWFEDARSIQAKLGLVSRYGLCGVGYWNLMRPFPQNWMVLSSMFRIRERLTAPFAVQPASGTLS